MGKFRITYRNDKLPWGIAVIIKYAYSVRSDGRNWERQTIIGMPAVGPYTWELQFEDQIASRGGLSYDKLKFVFMIPYSDGKVEIDKGS